ncbi:unnamed protein product [Prorocentrum cordatum]|uniref:Uncharacterized protein n=1 Tax=Prorocentrum cordatum TaxID=2364126 RepID=A0ABN9SL14_9DINO|nr:unnamed protein product [Polarella glacialis]
MSRWWRAKRGRSRPLRAAAGPSAIGPSTPSSVWAPGWCLPRRARLHGGLAAAGSAARSPARRRAKRRCDGLAQELMQTKAVAWQLKGAAGAVAEVGVPANLLLDVTEQIEKVVEVPTGGYAEFVHVPKAQTQEFGKTVEMQTAKHVVNIDHVPSDVTQEAEEAVEVQSADRQHSEEKAHVGGEDNDEDQGDEYEENDDGCAVAVQRDLWRPGWELDEGDPLPPAPSDHEQRAGRQWLKRIAVDRKPRRSEITAAATVEAEALEANKFSLKPVAKQVGERTMRDSKCAPRSMATDWLKAIVAESEDDVTRAIGGGEVRDVFDERGYDGGRRRPVILQRQFVQTAGPDKMIEMERAIQRLQAAIRERCCARRPRKRR